MIRSHRAAVLFLVVLFSACGGGEETTGQAGSGAIQAPSEVVDAGKLQFCVDTGGYPPAEYFDTDGVTLIGFDIDIGEGIAELFGVEAEFVSTKFDAIIPALQTGKCHAIISAMTDNAERRQVINFVDYVDVGSVFLVAPGNPEGIHSIDDLCGRNAAIIVGENWLPFLEAQSEKCTSSGQPAVKISEYNTATDELLQLDLGRVDTIVTNTINAAFVVTVPENQDKVEIADAEAFTQNPLGIGIRKEDTQLLEAVTKAVQSMYDDGTMEAIFEKYGMGSVFLAHRP